MFNKKKEPIKTIGRYIVVKDSCGNYQESFSDLEKAKNLLYNLCCIKPIADRTREQYSYRGSAYGTYAYRASEPYVMPKEDYNYHILDSVNRKQYKLTEVKISIEEVGIVEE